MTELIGKRCACVFALPPHEWPIPGYPAWVRVLDVDMPMVKLSGSAGGAATWVSATLIASIREAPQA